MILHGYWQNGTVIQQNIPYKIWGWEEKTDVVSVTLIRESDSAVLEQASASVENGCFSAVLQPRPGSLDRYRLEIRGRETITLADICFGEVWLTSGQSNMEFSLKNCLDREEAIPLYSNNIRYLNCLKEEDCLYPGTVHREKFPVSQLRQDGWRHADTAEHAADMSAVSFYLASGILQEQQVPVGIVSTALGGTTIEAWLPRHTLEEMPSALEYLKTQGRYLRTDEMNTLDGRNYTQLTGLFNERIAPLQGIEFRGVAWLQGESSAGSEAEAEYYRLALSALIRAWREWLGQKLPFLVMHIASENYQFSPLAVPHLNEAISHAAAETEGVWEIPVYDLPLDWLIRDTTDGHPIHPSRKAPYGKRLADVAVRAVYKKETGLLAPRLENTVFEGEKAVLRFSSVGEGLRCKGKRLRGFTLCGKNGIHLEADAEIVSPDTVEVCHPAVIQAAGVSYAYALYNQRSNLFNSAGLPAVPFRVDSLADPVYTEPREWLFCEEADCFESCFEPALGGAGMVPVWKPGSHCRENAGVTFAHGVTLQYQTGWEEGRYVSLAPRLQLAGRYHRLQDVDVMELTVYNPDARDKEFTGGLIRTLTGQVYYLPVIVGTERKLALTLPGGIESVYRMDLKRFMGCYLLQEKKEPADLSDMTALEFVFRDPSECIGSICLTGLRLGFYTENEKE